MSEKLQNITLLEWSNCLVFGAILGVGFHNFGWKFIFGIAAIIVILIWLVANMAATFDQG